MLAGWRERRVARHYVVIEPAMPAGAAIAGVTVLAGPSVLPPALAPAAIVFAVKPQSLEEVAPAYRRLPGRAPFLSIAAGKTLAFFARQLGAGAAVVRAMPSTPAAIGRGIAVACANASVDAAERRCAIGCWRRWARSPGSRTKGCSMP